MTYAPPPHTAPPQSTLQTGNPLGLTATIIAAVGIVLGLTQSVVVSVAIRSSDFDTTTYALVTNVFGVLQLLLGIAAIVLGAIGLASRGRPKGLAGIGVGGGAAITAGVLTGMLQGAILQLLS